MKILSKNSDTVKLLASPDEELLERGDYLVIEDNDKKLLIQVIDIEYADLPGMLEDTLRELSTEDVKDFSSIDPYSIGSIIAKLREARLIIGKSRGVLISRDLRNDILWLPSRFYSRIQKASSSLINELSKSNGRRTILLGECMGDWLTINAESLDGRLTIITGKKEMGKSHLAKLLVVGLVEYGARILVFDVNGEYGGLSKRIDGLDSELSDRLKVVIPSQNFKTAIEDAGLKTMLDILRYVYDTPPASLREFIRIWHITERVYGRVTLKGLIEALTKTQMNESIKEALLSRLLSIEDLEFFDDEDPQSLEDLLEELEYGGVLIVDLSKSLPHGRRLVVEYVLSKLSTILKNNLYPSLFLLAEEAHLYLRDTYWDDLVTRMRHIGIFPIFVTNQPEMIPDSVYRQADNIFLFNFTNDSDLDYLAKASRVDTETVKRIVKALPPKRCLVVGRVVNDIPIVVKIRDLHVKTMGETKLFFTEAQEDL